jgi:DNA-binding transcriptional ArsR family regulator
MMASRTEKFEELARVFHSLGDKTRLSIMMLLTDGEMNVTTLCNKLKLPQSSVSHHLSLLRIGGLVQTRRDGKQIFYSHAILAKHRLGKKSELVKASANSAKFGPAELAFPTA